MHVLYTVLVLDGTSARWSLILHPHVSAGGYIQVLVGSGVLPGWVIMVSDQSR